MSKFLGIFKKQIQCGILSNFNQEEFYGSVFSMLKKRNGRRQLREFAFYLRM